jgi:hypothetical protein
MYFIRLISFLRQILITQLVATEKKSFSYLDIFRPICSLVQKLRMCGATPPLPHTP